MTTQSIPPDIADQIASLRDDVEELKRRRIEITDATEDGACARHCVCRARVVGGQSAQTGNGQQNGPISWSSTSNQCARAFSLPSGSITIAEAGLYVFMITMTFSATTAAQYVVRCGTSFAVSSGPSSVLQLLQTGHAGINPESSGSNSVHTFTIIRDLYAGDNLLLHHSGFTTGGSTYAVDAIVQMAQLMKI